MITTTTLTFIQNMLQATLSIDLHLLTLPLEDLSPIDRSLRYAFTGDTHSYDAIGTLLETLQKDTFTFYEDEFFLHYVFFKLYPESDFILSIGPYSTMPINDSFFNKVIASTHIDFTSLERMKSFFYAIPYLENNLTLLAILDTVMAYLLPDAPRFQSFYAAYNRDKASTTAAYQTNDAFEFSIGTIENRYNEENKLLGYIAKGDTKNALITLRSFIQAIPTERCPDRLRDEKNLMYTGNSLFRKAAEQVHVHPVYLHQLSTQNAKRIEQISSSQEALHHMEDMVKKYCMLVKKHSLANYPPLIQSVINYININLSTPLSLSLLAAHFNVSSPHLSSLFKKEVGMNLTDFINEQRIHTSIKLLNTTAIDIHMIGAFVGINDPNYFTKLFKKHIGCTPREYRAKINS